MFILTLLEAERAPFDRVRFALYEVTEEFVGLLDQGVSVIDSPTTRPTFFPHPEEAEEDVLDLLADLYDCAYRAIRKLPESLQDAIKEKAVEPDRVVLRIATGGFRWEAHFGGVKIQTANMTIARLRLIAGLD